VALTITDKIMRSDQTAHIARLCHSEAGDTWRVSWLPRRLMDRNAAITAMTLADLVSEGEGIGLHDDPRWPVIDTLAAELSLSGPDAAVRISEPGPTTGVPAVSTETAGVVLCAHVNQDSRGAHVGHPGEQYELGGVDDIGQASDGARRGRAASSAQPHWTEPEQRPHPDITRLGQLPRMSAERAAHQAEPEADAY
jgi:hypothetical protein